MRFELVATDPASRARAGWLHTGHGSVPTPMFMPVGTRASVRAVPQQVLERELEAPILLGNTYHLYLRPGTEVLAQAGGLHRFMAWPRAILTDSGGYQIFSLSGLRRITDDGVVFRNHIDGAYLHFSPESVIEAQRAIGSDVMMVLDECPPWPCEHAYMAEAVARTTRWAERAWRAWRQTSPRYGHDQALFAIVQGGTHPDLRRRSAEQLLSWDFSGYAIGGLSVGEPAELLYAMTELVTDILPPDKPRYLMGVGTPENILEAIARGVDLFDCVLPTRNGRNGMVFTTEGILNIRNARWARDFSPLDPGLQTEVSQRYSKAYVRHLFSVDEILGLEIVSTQNLAFYLWLVREARRHILEGDFSSWKAEILPRISRRL
ncbi:MAG: tRNA guanosine(34) transglycosylase Tgt [Bacteroidetes bacterium]|nr:tRNA guanosine(34) transglycosylase Tgt [Bacteroidota bacterium]MDW8138105.1 tRNA guanosine(34) transglycosylase Tgt [Bacteroidota bacterium]